MSEPVTPPPAPLTERFDLADIIAGLISDLQLLRKGEISVRDARARAELARQILRGVHYVVTARKFLETQARSLPDTGKTDA